MRMRRKQNVYVDHDDYCEIIIRNKYNEIVGIALVDIEDKDKCIQYQWRIRKDKNTSYASAHYRDENGKDKSMSLHRLILSHTGMEPVDHINKNGLDDRKSNLRIVTASINNLNKDTKGVKKVDKSNYYLARFQANR